MFRPASLVLCVLLSAASLGAANKEQERLENAGLVMEEILGLPDSIPQQLLERAECVIVIPSMTKVAIGIGGSYGRGALVCRTGKAFDGAWGAPAMYALEGGSFGLQLGAAATDLVLLVMNTRGVDALLRSKVKLGAGVSAAAGPKGRDLAAATDASMRAEILSYSRSRGLFAGASVEGTSLRPDNDATAQVYGTPLTAREIVTGAGTAAPASGQRLVQALQRRAPINTSTPPAGR
ncbi:MAG: lipid-binding SYLF domain-containing protein [Acidobacteriota bacterium]